jgi:hypothetical protein
VEIIVSDYNGNASLLEFDFTLNITGIEETNSIIDYALYQNYPNPFNPSTYIEYSLPENSQVKLQVFNAIGELIGTIINEEKESGRYIQKITLTNLASGVYYYSLYAKSLSSQKDYREIRKMIFLK